MLITQASKRLSAGNFNIKLNIQSRDELGKLSSYFNEMAKKLEKLFDKVSKQKDEFDSLVATLQVGLCVCNSNGKIVLANENFKQLVDRNNIKGLKLNNLLRSKNFKKMHKTILNENKVIQKEIEFEGKYYLCSGKYIEMKDELVFTFNDISEIKQLEVYKKELLVNVSHELKTPLTAIKGFTETLKEEIEDSEHIHYINIIDRHTNRLSNIIKDLLTLSEIEDAGTKLELQKVDLVQLISNINELFNERIEAKKSKFLFYSS